MIFRWDAAKATANQRKHGVDFHEAATVLDDPLSTTFPDPSHSRLERRYLTVGMSAEQRPVVSGDSMKKARKSTVNEMRSEYDFASMKGGARGKYVKRYRAGTNLVLIEPELADAFPTEAAVNDALRAALNMATAVSRSKKRPKRRQAAGGAKRTSWGGR